MTPIDDPVGKEPVSQAGAKPSLPPTWEYYGQPCSTMQEREFLAVFLPGVRVDCLPKRFTAYIFELSLASLLTGGASDERSRQDPPP